MPLTKPNAKYDELKDAAKRARLPHDRQAWLNLAFFLDQQYVEWHQPGPRQDPVFRTIPRDGTDDQRPRPVVNKIMHYTRQAHASALQDKPRIDVLPATEDITDISDARVAKAWLDEQADPTMAKWDARLSRAALWTLIAGTGWLKWAWDPTLKRMAIVPCSFFEVFGDPFAREFENCRYIIHSQFMDVEQVHDTYGIDVKPDQVEKADTMKTDLMRGMGSAPVTQGVTVNELWHKPSRRHKDGLYVVWAGNDRLVEEQGLPYDVLREERKLPFTMLGCIERPDSMYCASPIQYLRSAQMELNKYHAQRLMLREKFSNMKWWIPDELQLQKDPDDSPFQILRGHSIVPGLKPELIQPGTYIPNDDGEMIEQQMMHIVGQHEVSQAQVPGRVEAAKAIQMLLDQDANALSHLRDTIGAAAAEGGYLSLRYAQQFESPDKMVTAYSREGLPEVKSFKAKALKPGFRVRTSMTTGLASSRAARQDQLMRLWDAKAITDQEALLDLMDLPMQSIDPDKAIDGTVARNENLKMASGTPIQARSWDDHTIHLREHNRFRKSADFLLLSNNEKQIFEFHCNQHEQLQKVALQKQAELALIMQGAAGGAPAPAGPGGGSAPGQPESSATLDQSDNQPQEGQ